MVLNAGYNDDVSGGFGRGYTWGEVLMHELGHVIGLDHVGSAKQLMHDTVTARAARFGAGDLNGFRKVGDTFGCLVADDRRARTVSVGCRSPTDRATPPPVGRTRDSPDLVGPGCRRWVWCRSCRSCGSAVVRSG